MQAEKLDEKKSKHQFWKFVNTRNSLIREFSISMRGPVASFLPRVFQSHSPLGQFYRDVRTVPKRGLGLEHVHFVAYLKRLVLGSPTKLLCDPTASLVHQRHTSPRD